MDMSESLITAEDVGYWFGVTFSKGKKWCERFNDHFFLRAIFPFWRGKVLMGKLWADMLKDSGALTGPIDYQKKALNKGMNVDAILDAAKCAMEKMKIYVEMIKTQECLELCRVRLTCDDITRECRHLLIISPKKRFSFKGTLKSDVILYLYACQVYFDEVRKVLDSERAKIPIYEFKLVSDDALCEAHICVEEATQEIDDMNYAKGLTIVEKGLDYNPFLCDLYGLRGRCHLGLEDYEAAVWDGQRSKLLNEHFALGYVVSIMALNKVGTSFELSEAVIQAMARCPCDESLNRLLKALGFVDHRSLWPEVMLWHSQASKQNPDGKKKSKDEFTLSRDEEKNDGSSSLDRNPIESDSECITLHQAMKLMSFFK